MFKFIKLFLVLVSVVLISCNTTTNRSLLIDFSSDSTKIVISNINNEGLLRLKKGLKSDIAYQRVVAVLQTPGEDDSTSMEVEWPGKLTMQGNQLVYTPDTTFKKGRYYLVETIINSKFASAEEMLRSDVGYNLKSEQKILKKE